MDFFRIFTTVIDFYFVLLFYYHLENLLQRNLHMGLLFFCLKKLYVLSINFTFSYFYCKNYSMLELFSQEIIFLFLNLYRRILILITHSARSYHLIRGWFENFKYDHLLCLDCFVRSFRMITCFCLFY